jgi:hypothetical protein
VLVLIRQVDALPCGAPQASVDGVKPSPLAALLDSAMKEVRRHLALSHLMLIMRELRQRTCSAM